MKLVRTTLLVLIVMAGLLAVACQDVGSPLEDRDWQLVSYKHGNTAVTTVLEGTTITARFDSETSEVTGAEKKIAENCISEQVADDFMRTFEAYQDFINEQDADLLGSQPTQGNIRGGLTTIEEKAFGNIEKMGRCKVQSVLKPAQEPISPGLHFMDSSSAAAEMVTLCCAAGATVHLFTTGQGNIIGNPILPVIKLSANPLTVDTMSEHIDVDLTGLLRFEINLDGAADITMEMLAKTINGRLTASEVLRHDEFVITKLYRSA